MQSYPKQPIFSDKALLVKVSRKSVSFVAVMQFQFVEVFLSLSLVLSWYHLQENLCIPKQLFCFHLGCDPHEECEPCVMSVKINDSEIFLFLSLCPVPPCFQRALLQFSPCHCKLTKSMVLQEWFLLFSHKNIERGQMNH